jgi:AraC-like DNA-binding protein
MPHQTARTRRLHRPPLSPEDHAFLRTVESLVLSHLGDHGFGVAQLADRLSISPRHLQRRLVRLTGERPNHDLRRRRLSHARALLQQRPSASIAEIADAVGMRPSYFSRVYADWAGCPPSRDRAAPPHEFSK